MSTIYDEVAYPGLPFAQTQPSRLGAVAGIFGLDYAPTATARVLEIGCGDGSNLIGLAAAWPDARFVGFDLAETAIAAGRRMVDSLGLANLRLETADIMDAPDFGRFDYVITHGVYAWVPPAVQEGLMALIGRVLEPHGVAFVSYNALPGAALRRVVRDMLLYRLQGVSEHRERLTEAQRFLRALVDGLSESSPPEAAVRAEAERMLTKNPAVLFHDELGECYEPVYVSDFIAQGRRHGLQHLGEAEPFRLLPGLPRAVSVGALAAEAAGDPARLEQYADFFCVEHFRQSLLRLGDRPIEKKLDPANLKPLHAASRIERDPDVEHGYRTPAGSRLTTRDAGFQALLDRLTAAWPQSVPLADVDESLLPEVLRLYLGDVIELHAAPRPLVVQSGERPRAFALARRQAESESPLVTTLAHTAVELKDAPARMFVSLLDGVRTRREVAETMAGHFGATVEQVEAPLEEHLRRLGRMALLEA